MTTDKPLSEKKMYQMGDEELDDRSMVYLEDDVHEAVKKLKQKVIEPDVMPMGYITVSQVCKIIDEVFGKELSE